MIKIKNKKPWPKHQKYYLLINHKKRIRSLILFLKIKKNLQISYLIQLAKTHLIKKQIKFLANPLKAISKHLVAKIINPNKLVHSLDLCLKTKCQRVNLNKRNKNICLENKKKLIVLNKNKIYSKMWTKKIYLDNL